MKNWKKLFVAVIGSWTMATASAEWKPTTVITVIIGQSPGSGNEVVFRKLTDIMSQTTDAKFIIEHRPGADGVLAWNALATKPKDGHSITVQALETSLVALPVQYPNQLRTDPNRSSLAMPIASTPEVWAVPAASPIQSIDDLIRAYQKEQLNVGVSGSIALLSHNMLMSRINGNTRRVQAIPYKSIPTNIQDLAAGILDVSVIPAVGAKTMADAGKIRIIAVADDRPLPSSPSLPLMQSRVKDFYVGVTYTAFLPENVPPAAIQWWVTHLSAAIKNPQFASWLAEQHSQAFRDPTIQGAGTFIAQVRRELSGPAQRYLGP